VLMKYLGELNKVSKRLRGGVRLLASALQNCVYVVREFGR